MLDAAAPGAQCLANATEAWCRGVMTRQSANRVLLMTGPFGTGKSHCLKACVRFVREARQEIWPEPWPHPPSFQSCNWAVMVREVIENDNRDAWEDLLACDVVFLDDLGSEEDRFKSGGAVRVLGDTLGRIVDQKKFAVLTTNIEPDGWKARWDGRVHDRLMRMQANTVDLWGEGGESYAVWKARQNN